MAIIYEEILDTTKENQKVEIQISYSRGEACGYREYPRGYTLHVQPMGVSSCGFFKEYTPTEGYKYFLMEVTKKTKNADLRAKELADRIKMKIVDQVLTDKKWQLKSVYSLTYC